MKIIYSLIFTIIILSACSDNEAEPAKYCENELQLISNFGGPIHTNVSIENVRKSPHQYVIPFLEDSRCDNVELTYKLPLENGEEIDLSFNILYAEDCDLPDFTPRYFCHIFVGHNDTLLIENELATMNSVSKQVLRFYQHDGSLKNDLENYEHVYISFWWDERTNSNVLNKTIENSIDGYLQFADSLANINFNKGICELNRSDLEGLQELIPFQFRTDFLNGFERNDFVGYIGF